jgi:hypothetical protein
LRLLPRMEENNLDKLLFPGRLPAGIIMMDTYKDMIRNLPVETLKSLSFIFGHFDFTLRRVNDSYLFTFSTISLRKARNLSKYFNRLDVPTDAFIHNYKLCVIVEKLHCENCGETVTIIPRFGFLLCQRCKLPAVATMISFYQDPDRRFVSLEELPDFANAGPQDVAVKHSCRNILMTEKIIDFYERENNLKDWFIIKEENNFCFYAVLSLQKNQWGVFYAAGSRVYKKCRVCGYIHPEEELLDNVCRECSARGDENSDNCLPSQLSPFENEGL